MLSLSLAQGTRSWDIRPRIFDLSKTGKRVVGFVPLSRYFRVYRQSGRSENKIFIVLPQIEERLVFPPTS